MIRKYILNIIADVYYCGSLFVLYADLFMLLTMRLTDYKARIVIHNIVTAENKQGYHRMKEKFLMSVELSSLLLLQCLNFASISDSSSLYFVTQRATVRQRSKKKNQQKVELF